MELWLLREACGCWPGIDDMPLTLHPVFKPALLVPEFTGQGEVLLAELESLDNLADDHGLMRLSAFANARSTPTGLDSSNEKERLLPTGEDWFECNQGRMVCERLAHIAATGSLVKYSFKSSSQRIAIALLALARTLAAVQDCGVQFRLEVIRADAARAVVSQANLPARHSAPCVPH